MTDFWRVDAPLTFEVYSKPHFITLALIGLIVLSIILNKEKIPKLKNTRKFLGILIGCQQILYCIWYLDMGLFTIQENLPLHFCRVATILTAIVLIKGHRKLFGIVYFWALTGGLAGCLVPYTGGYNYNHVMFLSFFLGHGGIIIGTFFSMYYYKYTPTIYDLRNSVVCVALYYTFVKFVNNIINANYCYLNGLPSDAAAGKLFPYGPFYVPSVFASMSILFTLLYLPFKIKEMKSKKVC